MKRRQSLVERRLRQNNPAGAGGNQGAVHGGSGQPGGSAAVAGANPAPPAIDSTLIHLGPAGLSEPNPLGERPSIGERTGGAGQGSRCPVCGGQPVRVFKLWNGRFALWCEKEHRWEAPDFIGTVKQILGIA